MAGCLVRRGGSDLLSSSYPLQLLPVSLDNGVGGGGGGAWETQRSEHAPHSLSPSHCASAYRALSPQLDRVPPPSLAR